MVLALPTGWLYDLWAGTGTEQGQQPSGDAQQLQRQEEIETCFLSSAPVTVAGGFYNRYYLMELGDNSWLCVYFDDYLVLIGTDTYPTGYVRYTTTEERRMLNRMAEDYDDDPVYVLDMYRYGKVNWMVDLGLRLAVVLAVYVSAVTATAHFKSRKKDRFLKLEKGRE